MLAPARSYPLSPTGGEGWGEGGSAPTRPPFLIQNNPPAFTDAKPPIILVGC
jgi:hypothetical protein